MLNRIGFWFTGTLTLLSGSALYAQEPGSATASAPAGQLSPANPAALANPPAPANPAAPDTLSVPAVPQIDFSVEAAPEWTSLFKRKSGWIGADGIFSIPLSGADSILLIFSDSIIGEIKEGTLQEGWAMVNNSVAYLEEIDKKPRFYWKKDRGGQPATFFVPATPSAQEGDYYWLGDGFVNAAKDNTTYIFAYRMRNMSKEAWSFTEVGNVLIKLPPGSRPPFKQQQQIETPLRFTDPVNNGSFGAGILVNTAAAGVPQPDGYIYVYGVRGKHKGMVVARVRPEEIENFSSWRFWDGASWNADIRRSQEVVDKVSNELSVSQLSDGRYALVFQQGGISSKIGLRLSDSPQGSFGPLITLWDCPEAKQEGWLVYNAKAHPALSRPGELIISYNVNAFDFLKHIKKEPNLYRPRFIRVKFE